MFDRCADEMLDRVAEACAARDTVLVDVALAVADAIGRDAFAAAGLSHGPSWLRAYTDSSSGDARRVVAVGRLLACHRATRDAVESGVLSIGRAGVLAGAVTDARRGAYRHDEDVLLAQAAALGRVDEFEVVVAHWCALVDQDTAPGVDHPQRLYLQHRFDGGASVRGELDARTTEVVRAGLDAFDTGPDQVNGPVPARSLAERRADALGDLAGHAINHTSCGDQERTDPARPTPGPDSTTGAPSGGVTEDVTATSDPASGSTEDVTATSDPASGSTEDVTATSDPAAEPGIDRRPARRTERTTNLIIDMPSLAGRTRTDLDGIIATLDGRPLAAWAAGQLLCDTWVAALVTDAAGAVIDATDRTADFTDTQRRLITARDRSCVFPGCGAPPSWCDVHHLHWKTNGGSRNLNNGALLCRRHHTLLHRVEPDDARWTLHRAGDGTGWHATSPTGTTWTGHPAPRRTAHQAPGATTAAAGREPPDCEQPAA